MSVQLLEMVEKLIVDGTKVGWYKDRIEAWKRGERIAPVTIDCAMTRRCQAACSFCVWPDTMILMADGSQKPIIEVFPGDLVLSAGGVSKVTSMWQSSPSRRGLKITLESGESLRCTSDHPILTEYGWMPAGTLRVGDYAFQYSGNANRQQQENAAEKSDETARSNCQNGSYEEGSIRKGLLHQTSEGRCRVSKKSSRPYLSREESYQPEDESQQPDAPAGSGSEGCKNSRRSSKVIGVHEEVMAGGKDRSQYVLGERQRQGCEQDGAVAVLDCSSLPGAVRWRRQVLVANNDQRCQQEPGLHLRERQGQDSPASSRRVLAPGQGFGTSGNQRLLGRRLEPVRTLGEASSNVEETKDSSQRRDAFVVARVVAIEDAGVSAVYDLECSPHHNFVADGIVVHNCYAQMQASESDIPITEQCFKDFLTDAAEIGVKGVSFISDGESTVVPWYANAVEHAAGLGLAVGAGSNGIRLTRDVLERVLPHLSYLRFNFSAGEEQRYAQIMGVPRHFYHDVIQNIRDGMEIINRGVTCGECRGFGGTQTAEHESGQFDTCEVCKGHGRVPLPCTLNMQLVCDPKDADQLIPFARLCCELKPTYGVIKHCADDSEGTLGVDYTKYDALMETFDRCEELGREAGVRIEVKRSRLDGKRDYHKCYGPPFIMQISGNGLVAPCGFLFNEKWKAFHIGNITRERFKDIWASDRYLEVMQYLASDHFDPSVRCGPNCLQHNTNRFLYAHVHNGLELPVVEAPPHLAFL